MNLSGEDVTQLRTVLKKISFFVDLKMSDLDALIGTLEKKAFRKGETIIRQGDPGDTFYILASGTLGVFKQHTFWKKKVNTMKRQDFFGEIALLENTPRSATVIGEEEGELYYLSRAAFDKVVARNPHIAELVKKAAEYRHARDKVIDAG